jgi:hypothetical protein
MVQQLLQVCTTFKTQKVTQSYGVVLGIILECSGCRYNITAIYHQMDGNPA